MSKAKRSAYYLLLGGMFSKAISFIGSILLARILFPEDYGYILIAMIFTGFVDMLGNMGFENYYLQQKIENEDEEERILFMTFFLRLGLNFLLFSVQFFGSFVYEFYFDEKIVAELIRYFSFGLLITAFTQVNLFILRKKLTYKPEVYGNTGRDVIGTGVKVLFASLGFGALSFAYGSLFGNFVRMLIIFQYNRYFPKRLSWDSALFKKIYFFGKHSVFTGIGMYATRQVDKIILTSFFPHAISGIYYFADAQSKTILSYLIHPQASLIMSYSAKYKHNTEHLYQKLSQLGYMITAVLAPIIIFLIFFANPIFDFVFGNKWNESVVLFQIFTFYYFITEITFPFSGILIAFGLPQIASKLVLYRFAILSVSLLCTTYFTRDIIHYLIVFTGISFIFTWIKAFISLKLLHKSIIDYLQHIYKGFVLFIIYVLILIFVSFIYEKTLDQMILSTSLFILISALMHFIVYNHELLNVCKLILNNNNKFIKYMEKRQR